MNIPDVFRLMLSVGWTSTGCCVLCFACVWLNPVVADSPPTALASLNPSFVTWSRSHPQSTYDALIRQFLIAAGRDPSSYQARLQSVVAELSRSLKTMASPPATARQRLEFLRHHFFEKLEFRADLNLESADNLFPDVILERRKGYCLGLSVVLLAIGEKLGWPLVPASAPRHTFVSYGDVHMETTLAGRLVDDAWYRRRFHLDVKATSAGESASLRILNRQQLAAHLINNHGYVLLQQGDLDSAVQDFENSLELWPGLVEARINRGVHSARAGRLDDALKDFGMARKAWPADPTLRLNQVHALLGLRRRQQAVSELAACLRLRPDHSDSRTLAQDLLGKLEPVQDWISRQQLKTAMAPDLTGPAGAAGLIGTYFSDDRLKQLAMTRVDRDLSFQWEWGGPAPELPTDHFSVRWSGYLRIKEPDKYSFFVTCSDGIRLWIDGRPILDAWRRANDNFTRGEVDLLPGDHEIRVEYFESVGEAGMMVLFARDGSRALLDLSQHLVHAKSKE